MIFKNIKGRNPSNLSIKHWFKAFELVAEHFTWNDRQKLIYLSNYLEDEALNWYLDSLDNYTCYQEAKEDMINQFVEVLSNSLGLVMKVKYEYKLGIQKYFEEIRKYATLANIKMEDILSLLKKPTH